MSTAPLVASDSSEDERATSTGSASSSPETSTGTRLRFTRPRRPEQPKPRDQDGKRYRCHPKLKFVQVPKRRKPVPDAPPPATVITVSPSPHELTRASEAPATPPAGSAPSQPSSPATSPAPQLQQPPSTPQHQSQPSTPQLQQHEPSSPQHQQRPSTPQPQHEPSILQHAQLPLAVPDDALRPPEPTRASDDTPRPLTAQTPADLSFDDLSVQDFDNSFDELDLEDCVPKVVSAFVTAPDVPTIGANRPPTAGPQRTCKAVWLAGPHTELGHGSAFTKRACARLMCTKCDFEVLRIVGRKWSKRVDYLFLRNHMPLLDKLAPMLEPDADSCAYGCQCSWRNVGELVRLTPKDDLRWVCGGH